MDMKKVVLKLYLYDERDKQKAMKTVATLPGVESLAMDIKEKQLTVIGDVDPVVMVNKLRKFCRTDVLSVGPVVEPAPGEEEPKKDEAKESDDKQIVELVNPYYAYRTCYPYMRPYYYV